MVFNRKKLLVPKKNLLALLILYIDFCIYIQISEWLDLLSKITSLPFEAIISLQLSNRY